mmetsp:Transcript_50721/g.127362  ORF Transcript_50721/g.127362 Transcript_50721/m.127362 type:complete len:239 (+) Transcript_50721:14-730(+)
MDLGSTNRVQLKFAHLHSDAGRTDLFSGLSIILLLTLPALSTLFFVALCTFLFIIALCSFFVVVLASLSSHTSVSSFPLLADCFGRSEGCTLAQRRSRSRRSRLFLPGRLRRGYCVLLLDETVCVQERTGLWIDHSTRLCCRRRALLAASCGRLTLLTLLFALLARWLDHQEGAQREILGRLLVGNVRCRWILRLVVVVVVCCAIRGCCAIVNHGFDCERRRDKERRVDRVCHGRTCG